MRCKNHYTDLTSTIGVCACCLRERLLHVIAAQEQALAQSQIQNLAGKHCNSDKILANSAFPRSVSPYINNRKRNQSDGATACSDNNFRNNLHHRHPYPSSAGHHRHSISDQLFYQTPEVAPTSGDHRNNTGDELNKDSKRKRSFIRFFSFANIFRSRNRKSVDSVLDTVPDHRALDSTFRRHYGGDESTVRRQACRDRGMSPVRNSDAGGVDESESNNATSEYETTESWKNTPRRTPARRSGGVSAGHGRNLSGLTFCLSPLVRASPNRQWNGNQKGLPPEIVFSGEIRAPVKAHLSNTKSFQANRSRKLADFGRGNLNR